MEADFILKTLSLSFLMYVGIGIIRLPTSFRFALGRFHWWFFLMFFGELPLMILKWTNFIGEPHKESENSKGMMNIIDRIFKGELQDSDSINREVESHHKRMKTTRPDHVGYDEEDEEYEED